MGMHNVTVMTVLIVVPIILLSYRQSLISECKLIRQHTLAVR